MEFTVCVDADDGGISDAMLMAAEMDLSCSATQPIAWPVAADDWGTQLLRGAREGGDGGGGGDEDEPGDVSMLAGMAAGGVDEDEDDFGMAGVDRAGAEDDVIVIDDDEDNGDAGVPPPLEPAVRSPVAAALRTVSLPAFFGRPSPASVRGRSPSLVTSRGGASARGRGSFRGGRGGARAAPAPARPQHSPGYCPFYKRVPGTPFVVDGFHFACLALSRHYVSPRPASVWAIHHFAPSGRVIGPPKPPSLSSWPPFRPHNPFARVAQILTHFHSDHYGGLSRSWDVGTIYCTPVTAALVASKLGVAPRFLRAIPLDTPTTLALPSGGPESASVRLTFLDANHCPGAAMALVELPNGTAHLHVGACHPIVACCATPSVASPPSTAQGTSGGILACVATPPCAHTSRRLLRFTLETLEVVQRHTARRMGRPDG